MGSFLPFSRAFASLRSTNSDTHTFPLQAILPAAGVCAVGRMHQRHEPRRGGSPTLRLPGGDGHHPHCHHTQPTPAHPLQGSLAPLFVSASTVHHVHSRNFSINFFVTCLPCMFCSLLLHRRSMSSISASKTGAPTSQSKRVNSAVQRAVHTCFSI